MNHHIKYFLLLLICFSIYSCKTNSLLPQTQNVPLFTDKNQLQADAALSNRTAEVQLAYSATPHIGFMLNGLMPVNAGPQMIEAGVGGFNKFGDMFIYEVYGGYGYGAVDHKYDQHNFRIDGPLSTRSYYDVAIHGNKFFIQPAFGVLLKHNMQLSLSIKASYWSLPDYYYHHQTIAYSYDTTFAGTQPYQSGPADSISVKKGKGITIEPALTFKTGGKHVRFMLQAGFSSDVSWNSTSFVSPYNGSALFVRVGISLNFNLLTKEK